MVEFTIEDIEIGSVCISNLSKFLVVSKTMINESIRIMWLDLYDSEINVWDYE